MRAVLTVVMLELVQVGIPLCHMTVSHHLIVIRIIKAPPQDVYVLILEYFRFHGKEEL